MNQNKSQQVVLLLHQKSHEKKDANFVIAFTKILFP